MNRDGRVFSIALRNLLASAILLAAPMAAPGQTIFRPAPRPLKIALSRAREAISEERFSDAVNQLGEILTAESISDAPDSAGQDFFYDTSGDASARRSIKTLAEVWLGELPKSARDLFELKYGGVARAMTEKGIQNRDYQLLSEVTRKYFFTKAGHEATLILARRHLDEGRPFASASLFDRVRKSPDANKYEPQVSLLSAMSWRLAGLNERAEVVLREFRVGFKGDAVQLGDGASIPLFSLGDSPLKWLDKNLGPVQRIQQSDVSQWAMHRGGADRNASAAGGMPLVNFRWRTPTSYDPDDEKLLRDIQRQNDVLGAPTIPSVSPLAVGDTVLMRSARRLVAVDFDSGKRIWEFPWDDTPDEQAQAALRRQPSGSGTLRYAELQERILEDAAYGQLASDQDRVFLISELSYATSSTPSISIQLGGIRSTTRPDKRAFNQLVSLNLKRQGAIHWIVGGADGWDEPKMAECFFLGAPLPLNGRLHVLFEQRGEIQLGVLDPDTGKLLWRQQLARVDERDITVDGKRRLSGATPTYADGVLVCPTSAGAVVAIDLATRALRWGRQYKTPPRSTNSHLSRSHSMLGSLGSRWLDASVTAAEGKVLLTPIESNVLICLDLFDGSRIWSTPRNKMTYLACVHNSRVIVVGVDQVLALDLASGGSAWSEPISLGDAMPSGRGFRSGDRYYLPTSKREILEIDLNKGAIIRRVRANEPLGNLLAYRGGIISQGVEWLSSYYQLTPLMAEIEQRLKANPDDPWALARQCELLLQEGKREEALVILNKTDKLAPKNPRVRRLTIETLLASLEADFSKNRQAENRLRDLIELPEDQARLLRALAVGFEASGEAGKAVDALIELAELPRDFLAEFGADANNLDEVSSSHLVRRERWIGTRLASLLDDKKARTRLDEVLPERLAAAVKKGDAALARFIELYGPHESANTARLKFAQTIGAEGRHLAAQLMLAEVINSGSTAQMALAEGQLAVLVEQSGRLADAAIQYRRLKNEFAGDVVSPDGKTGEQVYEAALKNSRLASYLRATEKRPLGRIDVEVSEIAGQVTQSYHKVYPFRLLSQDGPRFGGLRLELDQNRAIIRVSDNAGRQFQQVSVKDRWRTFNNSAITLRGRVFGHLAVVSVGANIYAVDALNAPNESGGPVMWSHNLSYPLGQPTSSLSPSVSARASANPWGVRRGYVVNQQGRRMGSIGPVLPGGVCFTRLRELVCVDPITGQTIWSRTNCPQGAEMAGDDRHVILFENQRSVAMIYDLRDGSLVGEREVPAAQFRLATCGANLLSWEDKPGETPKKVRRVLRLSNVISGETLFEDEFEGQTLGRVIQGEEFVAVQPDGRMTVISLESGKVLTKAKLDADSQLQQLLVVRGPDAYYVGLSHSATPAKSVSINSTPPAAAALNGKLYAVSKSGELVWTTPADLRFFFFPEAQPSDSPLLVLMRSIRDSRRNSSANQTSLLVLDRHDGRIVHFERQATPQIGRYRVAVADDGQSVAVYLHKKRYTYRLTSEPAPPAPVAYIHDPPEQKTTSTNGGANPPQPNPFGANPFKF